MLEPERASPTTRSTRGAYVLRDASKDGDPDLILIGTGSEVHICIDAADLLEADGIATRVVSAPCLERFAEQDEDYRDSVLPPAVRARVSVEAAATFGWSAGSTDDGDSVGMTGFGASAPAAGPVRALRLHRRERRRPSDGRSSSDWGRAHERRARSRTSGSRR